MNLIPIIKSQFESINKMFLKNIIYDSNNTTPNQYVQLYPKEKLNNYILQIIQINKNKIFE